MFVIVEYHRNEFLGEFFLCLFLHSLHIINNSDPISKLFFALSNRGLRQGNGCCSLVPIRQFCQFVGGETFVCPTILNGHICNLDPGCFDNANGFQQIYAFHHCLSCRSSIRSIFKKINKLLVLLRPKIAFY